MSERIPTAADLAERARRIAESYPGVAYSGLRSDLADFADRLAALEDTVAERDRAHATLREIDLLLHDCGEPDCRYASCEAGRLARERLANP